MKKKDIPNDKKSLLMLAYLCISTEKVASLARKVEILDQFSLSTAEIAIVCACTDQAVMLARHRNKKKIKIKNRNV
ncbi:MAG: hypothetical protein ABI543_10860 [Ignavibacteria bacterium]